MAGHVLESTVDRSRLAEFKATFPKETTEICSLRPLQSRKHLLDNFLLTVDEIVGFHRRRLKPGQVERVAQAIRFSKDGADKIQIVSEALAQMDAQQLEIVFSLARLFIKSFSKNGDSGEVFRLLDETAALLHALHKALQFGTRIEDRPTGRGRPPSAYVWETVHLMQIWENFIPEQFAHSPHSLIKRVPTPKKYVTEDNEIVVKQPSTQFIRIALRMIHPTITEPQVFTAIKQALSWANKLSRFARTEPAQSFTGTMRALKDFEAGRAQVRKKPASMDNPPSFDEVARLLERTARQSRSRRNV
jgi:hypothetical protein